MKKYLLFLLAFLPMMFTACSSSDDDDGEGSGKNLTYIQVKFRFTPYSTSDYSYTKNLYIRELYLFKLDGKHLKEPIIPYSTDTSYGKVCVVNDVNGNYVYSDYSGDFVQLTDDKGKYTFDCMAPAIYSYNFQGKSALQRGEHLIVIKAGETYFCKKLNINPQGDNAVYDFNLIQTGKDGTEDKVVWF